MDNYGKEKQLKHVTICQYVVICNSLEEKLQPLTDGNGLEIDKVSHLFVVSNTTMFAFINTHTTSTNNN